MIVITDGESHDSADLQQAIEDSEKDGITRYAIAVSLLEQLFIRNLRLLFIFICSTFILMADEFPEQYKAPQACVR